VPELLTVVILAPTLSILRDPFIGGFTVGAID